MLAGSIPWVIEQAVHLISVRDGCDDLDRAPQTSRLRLIDVWLAHGSNGLTAVRHLTDRNGIPVFVCSGHASAQDARTAGAIAFRKKSFRLSDLECAFAMVMEAEALADPTVTGVKVKLLAAHALSPAGR